MEENKIILTDADGCLLTWNSSFNLFMHERGYPSIPGRETNYSLAKRHNVSEDYRVKCIEEFNCSEYIKDLHPFADAREFVAKLNEEGYKFIVITSLSDDPVAYDYRAQNLEEAFGDAIIELHCLPLGESKAEMLTRWKDTGLFWIEDHVESAADGAKLGLHAIVIDHPYNERYVQHNSILRARVGHETPWQEIYEIIKGSEDALHDRSQN